MHKNYFTTIVLSLAVFAGAIGCQPKISAAPAIPAIPDGQKPSAYFATSFQSESQFIVEAIVTDIAEELYFAATHRLPDSNIFSVVAAEPANSPIDAPHYQLRIALDEKHKDQKIELDVNGPIWSPSVYREVIAAIAKNLQFEAIPIKANNDLALLEELLDATPETIERQDQAISTALEKKFANPDLHEQAALLLGAFLLREHSGLFFEIRTPLSRLTAHLALAQFLYGGNDYGINGKLAEAIMFTLVNDQSLALEKLQKIPGKDRAVVSMIRALHARNTGDFRAVDSPGSRSPLESIAAFAAMADYANLDVAWGKLDKKQKATIDYSRIAEEGNVSVGVGNQLLVSAVTLEMQEIRNIHKLSRGGSLTAATLPNALNKLPGRCFSKDTDGEIHINVIGWGEWAMFLQRHLCHTIQQTFRSLSYNLGLLDDAEKFKEECAQAFGGLRLYPFVRRLTATRDEEYRKAVDDGFKVTVASPQLVSAGCWNYLCKKVSFAPLYSPVTDPHVYEWHKHNPPPETVYDLNPRLDHPSLVNRPDSVTVFEQLHQLAPYDTRISYWLVKNKYKEQPTYDEMMALFQGLLPWSAYANEMVANSLYREPDKYEKFMLQAASLNPSIYYSLSTYFVDAKQSDKGVLYLEKACDADPDKVRVSNHALSRVRYYLKKGDIEKARAIADAGAEVYSAGGLEAKGTFSEATTNYDDAFNWFAKIEERYQKSLPLISFCERYKTVTGNSRFDPELRKREKIVFPTGREKAAFADFQEAPADGVLIRNQSKSLREAGMGTGNIIVAINDLRVHNLAQYTYIRDLLDTPELRLIVWQGVAYHEIKASPPNGRFGVDFRDYKPR